MSRDSRKLRVFQQADELVLEVYRMTEPLPVEERYGLQAQSRRAAVSVALNIVEGCARGSEREYLHFLNIATASAAETQYLLSLFERLALLASGTTSELYARYGALLAGLQALTASLDAAAPRRRAHRMWTWFVGLLGIK
jgi:four helix bundle protein